MSTTPNQKDLLAKKTDLEGILKPDANDILHLPDITITLAENGQFYLAGISKKLLTLIGNTSGNAVTLDGDAGLTFTTSGGSSTITGITSSSGNSTSLAASQSMVSAKQDALTAGTNITISNNTISATDTNTLSDLTDTAISSLADGQVLKYNATSGKWVNGTGGGGAEVILGTTAPTAAQGSNGNLYIQYDDTNNNTVTHEYVKISGAWEEIAIGGGGSSVIANPSGTATATLNKVEINNVIYDLPSGGGGGSSAEEITLAEYSELTTAEKNDGTIRFIPAGSGSEGLTAIDMTDITVYQEGSMNATAVSSNEIDVTWNGGQQIGCNFDFNTPIDVTDYDRITFKVTNGSCYNNGTQAMYPRWDMMIGLMSAPIGSLTASVEPTDSRWAVVADMPLSNHVYEEILDVSELTGNYYIVVFAHGWNTTIEDITLRQGGDYPSQIRYMSKTYAENSGAPAMKLTQAEYDALTQEEKENGTIYFVGGDTSTQLIERVSAADTHITSSGHSGWGGEDWGAFDGIPAAVSGITNAWCALEDDATPWIQYHFDQPYYLTKLVMVVYQHYNASSSAKTVNMNILGSNDGNTWTNIAADGQTKPVTFKYQVKDTIEIELNLGQYEYIRIQGTEAFEVAYNFGCDFDEIYVYGRANPSTSVQKIYYMGKCYTNTGGSASLTPGNYININNDIISVTAIDSQTYEGDLVSRVSAADTHITASTSNSSYPAWGAFNGTSPSNLASPDANSCWLPEVNLANQWIQYHFDSAKYFTSLTIDAFSNYSDAWVGTIKVEGSNDGTIFTNILENGSTQSITAPLQNISTITVDLDDSDTWTYIRITFVEAMSIAYYPSLFIDEIHFYGGSAGGNNIVSLSDFSKLSAQQISDLQSAIGRGGSYSTTEQVIGTWIDGSPLYQKTYHYPGTLSGNVNLDPTFTSSNIDYFTHCDMSYVVNNSYRGSGFQIETGFNSNGLFIDTNNAPNASYSDIYVTIRYTKVTQGQN